MYRKLLVAVFIVLLAFSYVTAKEQNKRAFEFNYSFIITDIPEDSKEVEFWAPIPKDTGFQEITDISIDTKGDFSINTEKGYFNKMLYGKISPDGKSAIPVSITFKVKRTEVVSYQTKLKEAGNEDMTKYLKASRLVTISDRIKEISQDITKGKSVTVDKARAIYDYVFDKMMYDKSGTGWGRGDTEYACDIGKGNCTDFHSLFISLARAAKIPARFKIGFPISQDKKAGNVGGYHCWAEYYDADYGWVPVDISEAKKNPQKKEYYFGSVCENRVVLTVGRDLTLTPKQSGEKLNFFIYPYVEIDGLAHSIINKDFSFKSL